MHKYKKESYSCRFCGKIFSKGFQVGRHAQTCDLNPRISVNKKSLVKHLNTKEIREKRVQSAIEKGSFAGSNNFFWRGGNFKSSSGWHSLRRKIWERDKICAVCNKPPDHKRKFDVHHIVSRRNCGLSTEDNLIGLHHSCHMKVECGKVTLLQKSSL